MKIKPTICILFLRMMRSTLRFASTPRMRFAAFLLGSNFIVGYGGITVFAIVAKIAKNARWLWAGTGCYALSWAMLGAGTVLAGAQAKTFSMLTRRSFRAWRKLRSLSVIVLLMALLVSCATVLPPQRPVAYMYPSLMKMSDIAQFTSKVADEEQVKKWLKEAGAEVYLQNYGFLESDYGVLARGLKARGYAEVDARRCEKCPLRWLYLAFSGENVIVGMRFAALPPDNILTRSSFLGKNGECVIKLKYE